MSGSTGNKAHGASEKPERGESYVSLSMAQRMLPLVRQIVDDILRLQKTLDGLLPEQDRLDRRRRNLSWPERQRRYLIQEEINQAERELHDAMEEMQTLGVSLLDPEIGRVGFPTLVNDRRAFFSWRPGEDGVLSWHFAGEAVCRPIPPSWMKEIALPAKR